MGKGKKRPHHPTVDELLQRPWCYYCERDFDDLKILHSHQKAKHFRCDRCNRRLNTAGGLAVHMTQVHKEDLTVVENALPNRQGLEVEIFGLEGVPAEALQQHKQRIIQQYYEQEAERRKATGNPAPGGNNQNQAKKLKTESTDDRKARLAEFKAKRASEIAGQGTGSITPGNVGSPAQSPPTIFPQQASTAVSQGFPPYSGSYGNQQPGFPQPSAQQGQAFGQNAPFNQQGTQVPLYSQNNQGGSNYQFSQQPPHQPFQPQFQGQTSQANGSSLQPNYSNVPPNGNLNLPNAQGLPQRPSFSTQPAHLSDMNRGGAPDFGKVDSTQPSKVSQALSLDELVSNAAKAAEGTGNGTEETKREKKTKKESGKNVKLIYSDNEVSPEEKMARLPRYAFHPSDTAEPVLGSPSATVTGTVRGAEFIESQA